MSTLKENKKEAVLKAFSQRLKEMRKAHQHTQAQLAQMLHISKSCVSNWEKGVRMPSTDMLSKIAALYSVSMEFLVGSSKRPLHYVTEDKFIDKERYLDLHQLCEADQYALKSHYEFLLSKYKG